MDANPSIIYYRNQFWLSLLEKRIARLKEYRLKISRQSSMCFDWLRHISGPRSLVAVPMCIYAVHYSLILLFTVFSCTYNVLSFLLVALCMYSHAKTWFYKCLNREVEICPCLGDIILRLLQWQVSKLTCRAMLLLYCSRIYQRNAEASHKLMLK